VDFELAAHTIDQVASSQNAQTSDVWRHPKYPLAPVPPMRRVEFPATGLTSGTASAAPFSATSPQQTYTVALGQLTPQISGKGTEGASLVWVPLQGHTHEKL
jgi:hypothetical protein